MIYVYIYIDIQYHDYHDYHVPLIFQLTDFDSNLFHQTLLPKVLSGLGAQFAVDNSQLSAVRGKAGKESKVFKVLGEIKKKGKSCDIFKLFQECF